MSPALSVLWNQHLIVVSVLKRRQLSKSRISTLSIWSPPFWVLLESTPTISICYCLSSALFQWIEPTSLSLCLSFLLCLVLQWIESTPNSSTFIVSGTPPPPNVSNIVHEHWVDCVSPLHWVDSVSPTFLESTACPLPSFGCLHAPTILRRLSVDYHSSCWHLVNRLSSCRLHVNYTRKPWAPSKSRVPCNPPQRVYDPSLYRLLLLPLPLSRLLVRVDHLSSRRPLVDVNYSLYQHLWKYGLLFKISLMSGLWTADTWAMSADAQLCDSGQWTSRDRQCQFWPCIPEV